MRTWVKRSMIGVALVALAIQAIPVDSDNPPEPAPIGVDAGTDAASLAILTTSCFDCHSNRTRWPWYSRVAPVSWLVARDVAKGREHLNFSSWGSLTPGQRAHAAEESVEEIAEGEMPMGIYLITHPDANLSADSRATLESWATAWRPLLRRMPTSPHPDLVPSVRALGLYRFFRLWQHHPPGTASACTEECDGSSSGRGGPPAIRSRILNQACPAPSQTFPRLATKDAAGVRRLALAGRGHPMPPCAPC